MVEEHLLVGLVVERVAGSGKWAEYHWRPYAILPAPPETPAWTPLHAGPGVDRYYAGSYAISLYSTETANYAENLANGGGRIWVVLRPGGDEPPVEVACVTADPSEGEAYTEASTDAAVVEAVAMPPEIAAAVAAFAEQHHVEHTFTKRKRDKRPAAFADRGRPPAGRGPGRQS